MEELQILQIYVYVSQKEILPLKGQLNHKRKFCGDKQNLVQICSLAALKVVIQTTFCAASYDNMVKMITF